jgi:hypothetical protein
LNVHGEVGHRLARVEEHFGTNFVGQAHHLQGGKGGGQIEEEEEEETKEGEKGRRLRESERREVRRALGVVPPSRVHLFDWVHGPEDVAHVLQGHQLGPRAQQALEVGQVVALLVVQLHELKQHALAACEQLPRH